MEGTAHGKTGLEARRYAATSRKHVECFRNDALGCLVLMHQDTDRTVHMVGFSGQRHKPDWEDWFATLAEADEHRRNWSSNLLSAAEQKAQDRAAKAAKLAVPQTTFKVGDVVVTRDLSYQYKYYEVTRLVGKKRAIEMRQIEKTQTESRGFYNVLHGDCLPRKGHYVGERFIKHVDLDGQIKFGVKGMVVMKKEAIVVNGVETFKPDTYVRYLHTTNY